MHGGLTITGTIKDHARKSRGVDGSVLLAFDFLLPAAGTARRAVARVVHPYGSGNAADYAASARAQRLRRGVRVVVHCAGVRPVRGVWVLEQISRIDEPDLIVRNVAGPDDH